jgi:serine/threonine-protein kinase RsbW
MTTALDDEQSSDHLRVVEVDIPSDVAFIERVVEMVRRECEVMAFGRRQIMLNVPVALTEALSNAILRGNGDDRAKHVHVRAEVDRKRLVVEVGDEGRGFDFDGLVIDPTTPENLNREDGRGLFLMRKLMDRVERIELPNGSMVRMTLNRAANRSNRFRRCGFA